VHDSSMRACVARRLSQKLDMLVCGLAAGSGCPAARIEFLETRSCNVNSQRMLLALGLLLGHVGRAAGVETLSAMAEAFGPDTSHVLRAVFVYMRTQLSEKGYRDAGKLLEDADGCRTVLRMLGARPSLRTLPEMVAVTKGVSKGWGEVRKRIDHFQLLRVASWNIAGGHRSAQAPQNYSAEDQRSALLREIQRWQRAFGLDVLALQECEEADPILDLTKGYEFVGSSRASALHGFVHLYVRAGVAWERLVLNAELDACVGARFTFADGKFLNVVTVHLPVGDQKGFRERCLRQLCNDWCREGEVGSCWR
jgi:hypothetical protein